MATHKQRMARRKAAAFAFHFANTMSVLTLGAALILWGTTL